MPQTLLTRIAALVAMLAALGLLAGGCMSRDPQAGAAVESCVGAGCEPVPESWQSFDCPAGGALSVVISTNRNPSPASQRGEAARGAGLIQLLAEPSLSLTVVGPLEDGQTYGTLVQADTAAPAAVMVPPDPPPAPNPGKEDDRRAIIAAIHDAGEAGCQQSLAAARAAATTTLSTAVDKIASGSGIGALTGPVPLERVLALADEHARLHPGTPPALILSSVPLTTPMPAAGLTPHLAGGTVVWAYESTGSAGNDRRLRDIASAYLATAGLSTQFIDNAYASPQAILDLLRAPAATTAPPSSSVTHP